MGSSETAHGHSHGHGPDEYLMVIWGLAYPVGEFLPSRSGPLPTVAARIADQLGVSRASVGEMLKRLEADGLIRRGEKEAILTPAGEALAAKVMRRHRLVERLLTDVMGYSAYESHEKTDGLDDGFDDEMVERLYERLGRPERCPHGYPIDIAQELAENPVLRPLDEVADGARAEVVRLAEHDGELLRFYYDARLDPGTELLVVARGAEGVRVERVEDGAAVELAPAQARGVFVRPEGAPDVVG